MNGPTRFHLQATSSKCLCKTMKSLMHYFLGTSFLESFPVCQHQMGYVRKFAVRIANKLRFWRAEEQNGLFVGNGSGGNTS